MAEFSPDDLEIGENPAREGQAVRVIQRLGEADAFLAVGDPFRELSPLGEDPSQIEAARRGRKSDEAKLFPTQNPFPPRKDLPEKIL